ncbi:MAG: PQQ-binding-like beta-propeller repeat protein [Planctomycetota bacterium]
MLRVVIFVGIVFTFVAAASAQTDNKTFNQFRGPDGSGVVADQSIPVTWSEDANVAWKVPIEGGGWSQPVIQQDRIYVTTSVSDTGIKPKSFASGVRTPASMGLGTKAPKTTMQWRVVCLNLKDGSKIWEKDIAQGQPKFGVHPSNSFATETPVVDQDGVYVYFGMSGTIAALSLDGKIKWQNDVGVYKTSNDFGTGSSLAIHKGKVLLQQFNETHAKAFCFDTKTGNEIWKAEFDQKGTAWSTPIVWKNKNRTEVVISSNRAVESFDPETGKQLWRVGNVLAASAASVCFNENAIFFGNSSPMAKGPLFAVSAGATGDVSPEKRNDQFENCLWAQPRSGPGIVSPVATKDFVYVVDGSVLKCFDAATGESRYKERLPGLKSMAASPLIVGNKLILIDDAGTACVVATGAEFRVLGKGKLNDVFWSSPAVSDNAIFIRGVDSLYCLRAAE